MSKIDLSPWAVTEAVFTSSIGEDNPYPEDYVEMWDKRQVLEMLRMMREKCLNVVNIWEDEYTVDKINEIPIEIPRGE